MTARATFPVELLEVPEERLPEAVEVAAYYVASEALANAAKYAEASVATARVVHNDGLTILEITEQARRRDDRRRLRTAPAQRPRRDARRPADDHQPARPRHRRAGRIPVAGQS